MADASIDRELTAKIHELDDAQKLRFLAFVEEQFSPPALTLEEWLEKATALRRELVKKYGEDHFFWVQDALDEILEEASWPRGS